MKNKIISLVILFGILSISLISLSSAENYIYAGNGIVIYPNYILKTVCHPFMPCGVERIDIRSNNANDNAITVEGEGDGKRFYDELNSPGLSQVKRDQESQTYNPARFNKENQNQAPIIIINTISKEQNNQPTIKHFPNTYNTRNNYDNEGNWIGNTNKYYMNPNSRVIVIYG